MTIRNSRADKIARRLIQFGFLLLFLYPLAPLIYKRITFRPSPTFTSWLLPFDPLLLLGELFQRNWAVLVIGAPLFLVALTLVLGRAFCGWVCPVGTVLDIVRPIAFWQKQDRTPTKAKPSLAKFNPFLRSSNSQLRYYVLIATLVGSAFSLQALGLLDPLVIFHRTFTAITSNVFVLRQPELRIYLSVVSLIFLGIVALELWQPRFWCRNLCPLGALLSLFSRWSLINRRVSLHCNDCGDCRRACSMNAIPQEPHDTDYGDCTLCLECEPACPKGGITFAWGAQAGQKWQSPQAHISIIADRCKGCGLCQDYCPRQVLTMSATFNGTGYNIPQVTDANACVACGVCQAICPEFAIYVAETGDTARRKDVTKRDSSKSRLKQRWETIQPKLSRRQLLGGMAAGAASLALVPVVKLTNPRKVIRPPGALPEDEFVRTCIACQECVRVCPTSGLRPTFLESGLAGMGTPQLIARQGGCSINPSCPDLCAQVCPVGAIRPIQPEELRIGLAKVDRALCLAWDQGVKCIVCVEACLVNAAQAYNGRVTVDPQRCTGCGRCESGCPIAGSAIRVEPL